MTTNGNDMTTSPSNDPIASRQWRDPEDVPGLIPLDEIEIRRNHHDAAQVKTSVEDKMVEIRWKRQNGLDWLTYRVIKVARVLGDTCLLLEKTDGSRSWASLRDVSFLRLHDLELSRIETNKKSKESKHESHL